MPPSLAHTIWLKPQATAFVYLPKVACTSWKLFFGQALGLDLPNQYSQVHDPTVLHLPYVGMLDKLEQQCFLQSLEKGELTLVSVVRDPRQRILSAYLDKIANHQNPNSYFSLKVLPDLRRHARLDCEQLPSFADFLSWIASGSSPHTRNDHWLPMSELLGLKQPIPPPHWRLWPMHHLEEAATYFNQLLELNITFPGAEALGSRQSSGSAHKLDSYLTSATESYLEQIYSADLSLYKSLCKASDTA